MYLIIFFNILKVCFFRNIQSSHDVAIRTEKMLETVISQGKWDSAL